MKDRNGAMIHPRVIVRHGRTRSLITTGDLLSVGQRTITVRSGGEVRVFDLNECEVTW